MTTEKMFEVATRTKMRFPFKGLISTEDLWDLTPVQLESIFKTMNSELKKTQEEGLLNKKTKEDKELEVKIEIVKHIVNVKLAEAEARATAKAKKEQKQKIMEIIAAKKDESLQNMSVEQLMAELDKLED